MANFNFTGQVKAVINGKLVEHNHSDEHVDDPEHAAETQECDTISEQHDLQNNETHLVSESNDPYETNIPTKRQRFSDPSEWKRNKVQKLREQGKRYVSKTRKKNEKNGETEKAGRKLGPRCNSVVCQKSTKRYCSDITEEIRNNIFNHFWSVLHWDQRRSYVASLVDCVEPKQKRRIESGDRRGATLHYFIKIGNDKKEVCREMFCNTFGLGVWSVRSWAKNAVHGMAGKSGCDLQNKKQSATTKETTTKKDLALEFINSLPKVPSHYCRKDTGKMYLENTFQSMMDLYRLYKEKINDPLSRFSFTQILNEMNIALFQPRKDQCDVCCEYKVGNLTNEHYNLHIAAKNRARQEKEKDKVDAEANLVVSLTVDVQAVKLCPFLKASAIYFKTKLCNHNYTVYNLKSNEVDCYWWSEAEGELKATNFTSLLVAHLKEVITNWDPAIPKIIKIWSDGCCYQNKNKTLSNALLNLAVQHNFIIQQKYLLVGHTQMEVDSVHATIERRLTHREIYLPSDYVSATREARLKPFPYRAHDITYEFFKDFSIFDGEYYSSIRPGKKVSDPTVNDVRHYEYLPSGEIKYKLNFDDELKNLPHRPKSVDKDIIYPQLYDTRLCIKESKWIHLQQLKSVIPKDCHSFYDFLPH